MATNRKRTQPKPEFLELGDAGFCRTAGIKAAFCETRGLLWWKTHVLTVAYENDPDEYDFIYEWEHRRDFAYADLCRIVGITTDDDG